MYGWRVPGEIIKSNMFKVYLNNNYMYNVESMRKYEITKNLKIR